MAIVTYISFENLWIKISMIKSMICIYLWYIYNNDI